MMSHASVTSLFYIIELSDILVTLLTSIKSVLKLFEHITSDIIGPCSAWISSWTSMMSL